MDPQELEQEQEGSSWAEQAPQPEKTTTYMGGSHSHREQILHHHSEDGEED